MQDIIIVKKNYSCLQYLKPFNCEQKNETKSFKDKGLYKTNFFHTYTKMIFGII